MKHKRLCTVMLAMLMTLAGTSAMAVHTPVPGPDFAGCFSTGDPSYAPLPTFNIMVLGSPVTFPAPGAYDFCAYADNVYCSLKLVASLAEEVKDFANLVQCLYMDLNGPLDLEADIPVSPNGIPDSSFELGILAYILNTTSHPLHAEVTTAFQENFQAIKDLIVAALAAAVLNKEDADKDLRSAVQLLAPYLTSSLSAVLTGFATMGDEQTNAALSELLGLLSEIGVTPPEGGIGSITTGVPSIGPYGDADGDGDTNYEEYSYFVGELGYNSDQYVAAALDPNQKLPVYDPELTVTTATGFVRVGDTVTLTADLTNYYNPLDYVRWYKNNVLIDGEDEMMLTILNAQESDSGEYKLAVGIQVEDKAAQELVAYVTVNVGDFVLPVSGLLGMAALAGACALAGARKLRRK